MKDPLQDMLSTIIITINVMIVYLTKNLMHKKIFIFYCQLFGNNMYQVYTVQNS